MSALPPTAGIVSRPETISEIVYGAIRDAIVKRQLDPGARVTEAGLARWLNVSKTPVREAMLRLQEIGLLEADGIRGSRVVQPSDAELRYAFEIREALEVFAAEQAANTLSETETARLTELAELSIEAASAGDYLRFREHDRAFHAILTSRNPRLHKMVADASDFLQVVREQDVPAVPDVSASAQLHREIARAITDGDGAAAGQAMRRHIRSVEAYYTEGRS